MKADLRATLEAIAAGKTPIAPGSSVIDEAAAEKSQPAFRAWLAFATPQQGEPIAAPAELLSPLP